LNKCDNYAGLMAGGAAGPAKATADTTLGRGVLHQKAAASQFSLARREPSAAMAPFVDFYWILRWDLRGRPPHDQTILPHPNVNLAFEQSGAAIYGVDRKLFARRIEGEGSALGVRFRAGGFRPFWDRPVAELNDRAVPAARLFGPAAEEARQAILSAPDDTAMVAQAEQLLCSARPARDPAAEQVAAMVARITADTSLRRVGDLATALGLPVRRLQRLFTDYVGVSPKWVMRRARLQEAAVRAEHGGHVDWAALATDLGYADQAHLTRDFTATIGVPPARYVTHPTTTLQIPRVKP
jgi:AraC-like DNA-binding protein